MSHWNENNISHVGYVKHFVGAYARVFVLNIIIIVNSLSFWDNCTTWFISLNMRIIIAIKHSS